MWYECSVSFLPGILQGPWPPARQQAQERCSRGDKGQIPALIAGLRIPLEAVSQADVLPSNTRGWKAGAVLKDVVAASSSKNTVV